MKFKSAFVAAMLLGSIAATGPAKADLASDAAIKTSLGLSNFLLDEGDNIFRSTISSSSAFLTALNTVAGTYTFSQIVDAFVNFGNSKSPGTLSSSTFNGTYLIGPKYGWSTALQFNKATGDITVAGASSPNIVPVPGPEAGAGIGALAMAGIAYVAMRRRKQQLAA